MNQRKLRQMLIKQDKKHLDEFKAELNARKEKVLTAEELARQAVSSFNIYQHQAAILGHASTEEELVKLMAVAIQDAMKNERLEIVGKLLFLRDEMPEGSEREMVNNLANELHYD